MVLLPVGLDFVLEKPVGLAWDGKAGNARTNESANATRRDILVDKSRTLVPASKVNPPESYRSFQFFT